MKVIDCHIHLGGSNYTDLFPKYNSTVERYLAAVGKLNDVEVEKAVGFSNPVPYLAETKDYFNKSDYYSEKNREIGRKCMQYDNFLFAVSVNPESSFSRDEIERCVSQYNARAVKVHLGANKVGPGELEKKGIIGSAEKHNIPIILHGSLNYSDKLERVISNNRNVNFVIAHLGFLEKNYVSIVMNNKNAFFDTSALTSKNFMKQVFFIKAFTNICPDAGHFTIHPFFNELINVGINYEEYIKIYRNNPDELFNYCSMDLKAVFEKYVEKIGSNKLLFGSDESWDSIGRQINFIDSSDLSRNDKNNIFYNNSRRIFF